MSSLVQNAEVNDNAASPHFAYLSNEEGLFHLLSFIVSSKGPFGTTFECVRIIRDWRRTSKHFHQMLNWEVVANKLMNSRLDSIKFSISMESTKMISKTEVDKQYLFNEDEFNDIRSFFLPTFMFGSIDSMPMKNETSWEMCFEKDVIKAAIKKYSSKNQLNACYNQSQLELSQMDDDLIKEFRREKLSTKLAKFNLTIDPHSSLCKDYIYGRNKDIYKVVNSVVEMEFYSNHTDYAIIHERLQAENIFEPNPLVISDSAKEKAFIRFIKKTPNAMYVVPRSLTDKVLNLSEEHEIHLNLGQGK